MPIESTDNEFVHIQWLSTTQFNLIVYQRRQEEPFDFRPIIKYKYVHADDEWSLVSVEHLNE